MCVCMRWWEEGLSQHKQKKLIFIYSNRVLGEVKKDLHLKKREKKSAAIFGVLLPRIHATCLKINNDSQLSSQAQ